MKKTHIVSAKPRRGCWHTKDLPANSNYTLLELPIWAFSLHIRAQEQKSPDGHQVRHASGTKWNFSGHEKQERDMEVAVGSSLIKVGNRREEHLCPWMHRASWKCTEVEAKRPRGSMQSLESRRGTGEDNSPCSFYMSQKHDPHGGQMRELSILN